MKINIEVKDKNGQSLEIGDRVRFYDWGFHNKDFIGEAIVVYTEAG